MNIEKKTEGTTATLSLIGWMDTQSVPEFTAALDELDPARRNSFSIWRSSNTRLLRG